MINQSTYEQLCDTAFGPILNEFGFQKVSSERGDYGYQLMYKNRTTGLSVDIETGWAHVFVSVYKLVNGLFPEYFLVQSDENDIPLGLGIEQILQRRKPSLVIWQGGTGDETLEYARNITPEQLEKVLSEHAQALRECAADILAGDFSLFQEFKGTTPR